MPRLLILAPTFYPDPGVQSVRVTQWARTLPDLGWETHVLCRHYGYEATPELFAEHVHPDVRLHFLGATRPAADPKAVAGKSRGVAWRVRTALEQLVVPDVTLISWRRLAGQARAIASSIAPDIVLSSSPPHSIHWLGRDLARHSGAKWAADFRDPYVIDERFGPRGWRWPLAWFHRRFESSIYRDADLTIHAIPIHGRWARRHYKSRRGRVEVLPNGAPSGLRNLARQRKERPPSAPIVLCMTGQIADEAPRRIDAALKLLAAEGVSMNFVHAGHMPSGVAQLPTDSGQRMSFLGLVPHNQAIQLVADADILLAYLSVERSRGLLLTSKLFEYLGAGRPTLVVNPSRPDKQLLRRRPDCETLVEPTDRQLADSLLRLVRDPRPMSLSQQEAFDNMFDRRRQAERLAIWLDELLVRPS